MTVKLEADSVRKLKKRLFSAYLTASNVYCHLLSMPSFLQTFLNITILTADEKGLELQLGAKVSESANNSGRFTLHKSLSPQKYLLANPLTASNVTIQIMNSRKYMDKITGVFGRPHEIPVGGGGGIQSKKWSISQGIKKNFCA